MYLLHRILLLPLSLFLLSLVCFGLRSLLPTDPVLASLPPAESRYATSDPGAYNRSYRAAAHRLGYDLPPFYFTVTNAAVPDSLHRIAWPEERAMLRMLITHTGDWPAVLAYYRGLQRVAYQDPTAAGYDGAVAVLARRLLVQDNIGKATALASRIDEQLPDAGLNIFFDGTGNSAQRWRLLLPAIHFHGWDNQYHFWLNRTLRGDLGVSYVDSQPVARKIADTLPWTLLLNALAMLVVFVVAIPLGLYLARTDGTRNERGITFTLFLLYGIPSFWTALVLATFLTTPAYGLDLFPSMGFGSPPPDAGLFQTLATRAAHLFLPVMCLAYPAWAYVSQVLKQSAVTELRKAYIKTAKMKGLSERWIMWRHVLRNASFPLITIFGTLFPGLLGGSILIERIFNLPGMGQLLFSAATTGDWPVVLPVVLINGVLTALGLLAADIAYALADPRVQLARPSLRQPALPQ